MKYAINKSQLAKIFEQRNGYLVLCCGLLIVCFTMAVIIFCLADREKIIIAPPELHRSFWVTNSEVSPEYLSEMALFFIYLRFNLNAENVEFQRESLLHYVDPGFYGEIKGQLLKEEERIKNEHLSSFFYPNDLKVDPKKLTVLIIGDLQHTVGKETMPAVRINYEIRFGYHSGRLLVRSLNEVALHD
jgi:conjugal transfer pilus assembly protein TraE